jgi:hypothetical protein
MQSSCEESTSLEKWKDSVRKEIPNISIQELCHCIGMYFQKVQGLLRSGRLAL